MVWFHHTTPTIPAIPSRVSPLPSRMCNTVVIVIVVVVVSQERTRVLGARKLFLVLDLDHTLLNSAHFSELSQVRACPA